MLGCGQHDSQPTSPISCWNSGWLETIKIEEQPKESLSEETGRNTLQLFKCRSVPTTQLDCNKEVSASAQQHITLHFLQILWGFLN